MYVHVYLVTQSCLTICNPMNRQAPLSIEFSWQEYCSEDILNIKKLLENEFVDESKEMELKVNKLGKTFKTN